GEPACWRAGAIFGEFLRKKPLFAGHGELDTLNKIFKLCGTPTDSSWPEFHSLPHIKNKKFFNSPPQCQPSWREVFPPPSKHLAMGSSGVLTDLGLDLLQKLLELNPAKRITAAEALQHEYFQEKPRPQLKELMPTFPDTNSQARRKRRRLGSGNNFDEQKHQDSFRFGARVDAEQFLSALADQTKEKKKDKKSGVRGKR
ncbi:putative cell-cycle-associated protein kinase CDK, partial [Toxoplasma gondii RUB]